MRDQPFDSDSTPQVAQLLPNAPEGHEFFFAVRRSDLEVAQLALPGESADDARQRLGPRIRCECGRGFPDRARFDAHLRDPTRDQRNQKQVK